MQKGKKKQKINSADQPGKHENTFCIILQGGTHTMKEIIQGFYQKKHFWTPLILVIAAVILMGFALSSAASRRSRHRSVYLVKSNHLHPPRHQHWKLAGALQYRPAHLRYRVRRQKFRLWNPRKHVPCGLFHRLFLLDLGENPSAGSFYLNGRPHRRG